MFFVQGEIKDDVRKMPPPSFLPHGNHSSNTRNSSRHPESGVHMKSNEHNPHLSSRFSGSGRQSSSSYISANGTAVSEGKLKSNL